MIAEEVNEKLSHMLAAWSGGQENPCMGVWRLDESPVDYKHSPALIYITGYQGFDTVSHYMEIEDIDLKKKN